MSAIFEFQIFISQPFEELQGWNLEFLLISPKYFYGTLFGTISAILDFSRRYISAIWRATQLKFKFQIFTPLYIIETYFHTNFSMFGLALSDAQEKAEGPHKPLWTWRPPSPLQELEGGGTECPKLLVCYILHINFKSITHVGRK